MHRIDHVEIAAHGKFEILSGDFSALILLCPVWREVIMRMGDVEIDINICCQRRIGPAEFFPSEIILLGEKRNDSRVNGANMRGVAGKSVAAG